MGETENEHPSIKNTEKSSVIISFKITVYLEGVGKVHSNFCCTEDEGAGVGPDQELDDSVV